MNNKFNLSEEFKSEMISNRRYLHQNPELGFDLPITIKFVMEKLQEMGLEPVKVGEAGVTATIGRGGKTILLRGDMDALPAEEINDLEFKSTNGFGNLCGHDIHTVILLGAAKVS